MAKYNKDTQSRIDALREEATLQANLSDILKKQLDGRTREGKLLKENTQAILEAKDIESKLSEIAKAKEKIISDVLIKNEDLANSMLEQLEHSEELLKQEQKRKDKSQEIKDLANGLKDSLLSSVGLSTDMLKNGIAFGIGMAVANKGVKMLSTALNSTVGLAKDLYINVGASASEAGRLATQMFSSADAFKASLLYGEGFAQAAKDAVDYYGSTRVITGDMRANMAELSALGVKGPAQMSAIFKQAAGSADEMTDSIKAIATKEGVATSALIGEMAKNQNLLVGKSKEQLQLLARQTAEMVKQGQSMELLQSVSENVLNIEGSLRAEMKARLLTGKEINGQAVRNAAMIAQTTGDYSQLSKEIANQVGSLEDFNQLGPMGQKAYADAFGMNIDQMTEMLVKEKELSDIRSEFPNLTEAEVQAKIKSREETQKTLALVGGVGTTMYTSVLPALAQSAVLLGNWKNSFGGIGKSLKNMAGKIGGLFGGKGGGNVLSKAGDQTQQLSDKTSKVKTKGGGPGGFLKSLGKGLESMGKNAGKKLLGAAVLAATVALVGGGFALAMTILGDVDPKKMLAFSISMGILGATLALIGSISGNVIVGALALGIVALALIPAAFAFSLLEDVDTNKMIAFSIALPLLALAAAGLGFLAPFIILGAGAIAALGLAIMPAAVAFGMLGDANMEGIVDKLANLGQMAGPLMTVGIGLVSIAAGLSLISAAGLLAIPALGMLIGLAAVAPALTSLANVFGLGGGDSSSESGSEKDDLLDEIKGLRRDIQAQPIQIVIDDKVVSTMNKKNVRMQSYRDQLK